MQPQSTDLSSTAVPVAALRLATTRVHGRRVVSVAGEIDIATAQDLYRCLCDTLDSYTGNGSKVVSVDLSAVTFMDASGLTALIRAETHAHTQGARLHLTALNRRVTGLLRITGLEQRFDLCPTSEDDRTPSPRQHRQETLAARAQPPTLGTMARM